MEMTVPGINVRLILESLRLLNDPQYDFLLTMAGWSRFRAALPPPTTEPAATEAEYNHLFGLVYTQLGESLTRLFLRTFGQKIAGFMVEMDLLKAKAAEGAQIPADRQVGWFAQTMVELAHVFWGPVMADEDAQAYYIAFPVCTLCAEIKGAQAPICSMMPAFYQMISRSLIGRRLESEEVTCAALGAPYCKYAIYKN